MDLTHAVRTFVLGMPFMFRGRPKERAGVERLASRKLRVQGTPVINVRSPAFEQGGWLPAKYSSAEGDNVSPPLAWAGVPEGTEALVLLVEDPDAPTLKPFVHWLAVLPGWRARIDEGESSPGIAGKTTMFRRGWLGAAPPKGDFAHHYHFQLFALDTLPKFGGDPGRSEVLEAMRGHVIGFGELVGRFGRAKHGGPAHA